MATVMLFIGVGLFYSLIIFFICEEKSLKDANLSDMKCLVTKEIELSECFEKYNTIRYMAYYFIAVLIFSGAVANFIFVPKHFGLAEVMGYTFITSLLGSLIILLVKWRFQPVIKLISSFMFGGGFMSATGLSFALVYLING